MITKFKKIDDLTKEEICNFIGEGLMEVVTTEICSAPGIVGDEQHVFMWALRPEEVGYERYCELREQGYIIEEKLKGD